MVYSDGVSRLGLSLETCLETHFCESPSRSRILQVSVTSQVSVDKQIASVSVFLQNMRKHATHI